jgi:glycerol-3-phosphate acyltransferase PlsY
MLAALLIFQHRDNLSRLAAGTESKIGQKAR